MKMPLVWVVSVVVLFVVGCTTEGNSIDIDSGEPYYPLVEGHWLEYQLDSIVFDDFDNSVDTTRLDVRLVIGEQIPDGEESTINRIYRYHKPRGMGEYTLQGVWFAKVEGRVVEVVEENLRFIKLALPPIEESIWDGNQFILPDGGENPLHSTEFYQDWEYYYKAVGVSETINGLMFDNVIKVNEINRPGPPGDIHHFVGESWYAHGVGLIKKRWEMVTENCGNTETDPMCQYKTLPVIERPFLRKGFIVDWTITGYGN